jgi:hypothetical protein
MKDIDTGFLGTEYGLGAVIAVVIGAIIILALLSIFVVPKAVEAIRAWKGKGDDGVKDKSQDEKISEILGIVKELDPIVKNNAKDILRVNSKMTENSSAVRCLSACRYIEAGGNGKTAVEYADSYRAGEYDDCPEEKERLGKLLGLI